MTPASTIFPRYFEQLLGSALFLSSETMISVAARWKNCAVEYNANSLHLFTNVSSNVGLKSIISIKLSIFKRVLGQGFCFYLKKSYDSCKYNTIFDKTQVQEKGSSSIVITDVALTSQLSGKLFGPSEKWKKLSQPILWYFLIEMSDHFSKDQKCF